jgi:hypothetical protein
MQHIENIQYGYLLNKYLTCSVWSLAVRYDPYMGRSAPNGCKWRCCRCRLSPYKQCCTGARPGMYEYVQRYTEARSCNYCCSGKTISITYSECEFIDLGIRHAMRMLHIVIRGLPGSTVYFCTLSHSRHDCRQKVLNVKYVFSFSLQFSFLKYFSL